ncbi:hypothetical protein L1987_77280 [Smallanthus sonchifolius]|uniref:Uncharacterized protein n=1 Tax=Smallanthus sonchifolius TaxID=185202 RepID=A0ACB8ZAE4_9ASTR|nr:hypothetical protein L1987_77280 [Smallanthus sonchifolius]
MLGEINGEKHYVQLQAKLNQLQHRLDSLAWDRKELLEHIRVALEEQEMMEMMLDELEEDHDEAIHKIKLLETKLQDLKDENHRLKEVHGKSQWDTDTQVGAGNGYGQKHNKDGMLPWKSDHYKVTDILLHKDAFNDVNKGKFGAGNGYGQKHNKDGMLPWKSDHYKVTDILLHKDAFNDVNKGKFGAGYGYGQKHNKDGMLPWKSDHYKVTDILLHKDAFNDVNKGKFDAHESAKSDLVHQFINGSVCLDNISGQRREVAVSQSLFSAMLSLLVGMVIWEAQEPCMPLVTALFMVVGMSLKSVVQFFSTIKNKPASDAVALESKLVHTRHSHVPDPTQGWIWFRFQVGNGIAGVLRLCVLHLRERKFVRENHVSERRSYLASSESETAVNIC